MKVIELDGYGGADALRIVQRPKPAPGPGQVLVRIAATSLNPVDPKRASGALRAFFDTEFPFVPGGDFSGTVAAVGKDVEDLTVGEAVFGHAPDGGTYAEFVLVDADHLDRRPASLDDRHAAAIAMVGLAATQAFEACALRSGQRLLVHGAGGTIGGLLLQLARHRGVELVATASAADADRVRAEGAVRVLVRGETQGDIEAVDAAIDAVATEPPDALLPHVAAGGVLVSLGMPPSVDAAARHTVQGTAIRTRTTRRDLAALRRLVDAGVLRLRVAEAVSLWDAADAWRRWQAGEVHGKLVFVVDQG